MRLCDILGLGVAVEKGKESPFMHKNVPSNIEAQGMRYVIAPSGIGQGDIISSRSDAPVKPGMTKQFKDMPTGTVVHNVELMPGRGAVMCRAAGTSATLIKNGDDGFSLISLPSGVLFSVSLLCAGLLCLWASEG